MTCPVWICEFCGGPAKWTFYRGEVYYHCESQCDGFSQLDMFDEGLTSSDFPARFDTSVSVSGLEQGEQGDLPWE